MVRPCILFLLFCSALIADTRLDELRSTLLPMRKAETHASSQVRDASPALTVAKHQLLDWLDTRMAASAEGMDVREFERSLNLDLRAAGLVCDFDDGSRTPCPEGTLTGFAGPIAVTRRVGFIVITAGVGIECGYDDSAYIYKWDGAKWTRIWQNEQNTYTKDDYKPQTLQDVLISPYDKANDYLVLTLGSESWCSSNWHDVYYRVFRLGPEPQTKPLVEGGEWTAVGWRDPPIVGSIGKDDVLLEYFSKSLDDGYMVREGVHHYRIERGSVKRIDPFALNPRGFVDEWLATDWHESGAWSEIANRRAMLEWRQKFEKGPFPSEFLDPTMRCRSRPDLWQVGVNLWKPGPENDPSSVGSKAGEAWFTIRWRPPYVFRMVSVSATPSPDCTIRDPAADEVHMLFPIQDWR